MRKRKSKRETKHWFLSQKKEHRKRKILFVRKLLSHNKLEVFKR